MSLPYIPFTAESQLDWLALTDALEAGHALPRAEIADTFLRRRGDTLLNRAAWIDGLGLAVKSATIFPDNRDLPTVNGAVTLFSDEDGTAQALVDFHLVTKWKTVGDSLLAARKLAPKGAESIAILGAGSVAGALIEAYSVLFPDARFTLWNRTQARAEALAADFPQVRVAADAETAVAMADIVCCATMSTEPVLRGDWLRPGQHVDLIGAYRADMREADDAVLKRARIFLDSRDTVLGHIGELAIPIAAGVIGAEDVVADYYDLAGGAFARQSDDEITLFKNGGGAHLDLMTARYILDTVGTG